MNSRMLLAGLALVAMATSPALADDGKVKTAAKKVGQGIMWGPKKVASATKKGATSVKNGTKKVLHKS